MKNMKIEINDQQPLGDVVMELERLGYAVKGYLTIDDIWILAQDDGNIIGCDFEVDNPYWETTNLTELRSMPVEQLKEL